MRYLAMFQFCLYEVYKGSINEKRYVLNAIVMYLKIFHFCKVFGQFSHSLVLGQSANALKDPLQLSKSDGIWGF